MAPKGKDKKQEDDRFVWKPGDIVIDKKPEKESGKGRGKGK